MVKYTKTKVGLEHLNNQELLQGLETDVTKLTFNNHFESTLNDFPLLRKQWNKIMNVHR